MPKSDLIEAALRGLTCQYAFYYKPRGGEPIARQNNEIFLSASIIKVPLALSWLALERAGEVSRSEMCPLRDDPAVRGSGLSWLLAQPALPYADVLLLMLAVSDNLCTNLVIDRIGLERAGRVFRDALGLGGTRLERKMMDYAARGRGLENRVSAADCVRLFTLRAGLDAADRRWLDGMLLANTDQGLLLRNVTRDTVDFCHKTGNIEGVLHDWGYTEHGEVFLLTQGVADEGEVYRALDVLGPATLAHPPVVELA